MKRLPIRLTLRTRIMVYTGSLFLILALLIVVGIVLFVVSTEQEAWEARQIEAVHNATIEVVNFLERNEATLYGLDRYFLDENSINPAILRAVFEDNPTFLEVVLLDKDGNVIQDVYKDKPILANQFTILQSEWFKEAISGQKFYTGVQVSVIGESYLIFSMPSHNGGVIAAQIKMDALWKTVSNIRFGQGGSVYVVDKQGKIIAHSDKNIVLSNRTIRDSEFFTTILQSPNYTWYGDTANFKGEKVVSSSAMIETTGWILITELPRAEAYKTSRQAMIIIPLIIIFFMVLATLLYREFLKKSLLEPINRLSQGAFQLGQGNLSFRIEIPRMDELGEVMSVFNTMAFELEKQQENLQKAVAFEYESQRARELDILLKVSEATSSSLDLKIVLHTLATQLLALSGFESCFISEWDKESNTIVGRIDLSKTFWKEGKRDIYSLSDYPRTKQVLLTGEPIIIQGDFETEEKQWMEELKRTAVIILALYSQQDVIGLVEIASTKENQFFDASVLDDCQKILAEAASTLAAPLPSNAPQKLFEIEEALLQATGAEVCSFSEWDRPGNRILNTSVVTNISWDEGQGTRFNPELEIWNETLQRGETCMFVSPEEGNDIGVVIDGTMRMDAESIIIFPLRKGNEQIGVIELYDFNHRRKVASDQVTLLRTIADRASLSIENARLLSQTKTRLEEKTVLLREKEILLKEIHHRVKNNLQIISSLLNLQSYQVKDTGTLKALHDSQARIRSMALIHEKLYQSQSLAKIDFGGYVQSLTRDLFHSYQRVLGSVQLDVNVDMVYLDLDQAVPCGLILNELITNALKYAFPNERNGTIYVELQNKPSNLVCLTVTDDGVGLPAGLDLQNPKSLGWNLINSLAAQLEGKVEVKTSPGTSFKISFQI